MTKEKYSQVVTKLIRKAHEESLNMECHNPDQTRSFIAVLKDHLNKLEEVISVYEKENKIHD